MEEENKKDATLAMVSMICGILSIVCGGVVVAIPALLCGHIAIVKIKRGKADGLGMAIAGLVMGYVSVLLFIIFICVFLTRR